MPEITLKNSFIFLLFIFVVGLLFYILSRKSKKYSGKYSEYFQKEDFTASNGKPIKSRIKSLQLIILGCLLIVILIVKHNYFGEIGERILFMFVGILISSLLFSLFIALRNFFIYKFIHNNPESLSGKIILKRDYTIANYESYAFSFSILFIFPFMLHPSYFTFGMIIGPLVALSAFKKGMGLK